MNPIPTTVTVTNPLATAPAARQTRWAVLAGAALAGTCALALPGITLNSNVPASEVGWLVAAGLATVAALEQRLIAPKPRIARLRI